MLNAIMLRVIILNVFMVSVILVIVEAPTLGVEHRESFLYVRE
jgi:hypothetical protein